MSDNIEIVTIDDQISQLDVEEDEIQEERKVDNLIDIKKPNGEDGSTNKSVNQIFDKKFKDLDNLPIKSCTIFKVNVSLRESNPNAYTPKMISIGPYHNKNSQLHPMEKYKLLYLRRFLQRTKGLDVESCIRQLELVKDEALKCYHDIEEFYRDNNTGHFLQILLLDGCFVIEFLREGQGMWPIGEDRIINVGCLHNQVHRDLMLLENQLPFFILAKLHDMTKDGLVNKIPLTKQVKMAFYNSLPKMTPASYHESEGNVKDIKHLLQVVHMSCHPSKVKLSLKGSKYHMSKDKEHLMYKVMPNATELSEAGVSFEKVGYVYRNVNKENIGDATSLFDIKFENGLMKIPCFKVTDSTEIVMRNLIAYEQQFFDVYPKYFSDYVAIMDYLIDSNKDVSLLRKNGIIENMIGEDKKVAKLFNKIGKGVTIASNFYYKEECQKASQHCKKRLNQIMTNLRHNYFSSIWKGTATVAAIIVVILAIIQTVNSFKK